MERTIINHAMISHTRAAVHILDRSLGQSFAGSRDLTGAQPTLLTGTNRHAGDNREHKHHQRHDKQHHKHATQRDGEEHPRNGEGCAAKQELQPSLLDVL